MKSTFFCRFSVLVTVLFAVALATPALAAKKAPASTPSASPAAESTPAAEPAQTPAASAAAPVVAQPAPVEKAAPLPASVTVGEVTISHMTSESSHGHIDFYLSIKNNNKEDERLIGAGSTWDIGDIVQVTKDKDGKEKETPVSVVIPAGKSIELSSSETWLRVTSIKTKPKDASVFPVSLYFRHSPNANLKIAMDSASGGKGLTGTIGGWFSK